MPPEVWVALGAVAGSVALFLAGWLARKAVADAEEEASDNRISHLSGLLKECRAARQLAKARAKKRALGAAEDHDALKARMEMVLDEPTVTGRAERLLQFFAPEAVGEPSELAGEPDSSAEPRDGDQLG